MMAARKETIHNVRAIVMSVVAVCLLIAFYWIASEWQELPRMLASLKAELRFPA